MRSRVKPSCCSELRKNELSQGHADRAEGRPCSSAYCIFWTKVSWASSLVINFRALSWLGTTSAPLKQMCILNLCSLVVVNLNHRFYHSLHLHSLGLNTTSPSELTMDFKVNSFSYFGFNWEELVIDSSNIEAARICSGDPQDVLLWRTQFS